MKPYENEILSKKLVKLNSEMSKRGVFKKRNIAADKHSNFSFLVYTLQRLLDNYAIDELLDSITDGPNDQTIDVLHIEEDDGISIVKIIQGKYRTDKTLDKTIGENEVEKFCLKVEKLFINGNKSRLELNPYLREKFSLFQSLNPSEIEIHLYLSTNGNGIGKAEKSIIDEFREKYRSVIKSFHVLDSYEFFVEPKLLRHKKITLPIKFDTAISVSEEVVSHVVNISAYEIAKLYEEYGDRILDKNVRKLLRSETNESIEISLKEKPKLFWHQNNGLSIVCRLAEIKPVNGVIMIEMEDPYIVNGGQTTKTIYNLFQQRKNGSQKDLEPFYQAKVLVKVYQTTNDDIIQSIVVGTNNQNKILISDLKSQHKKVSVVKELFAANDISLLTKRDDEAELLGQTVSLDNLVQIYWSLYGDSPNRAKTGKSKLISDEFDGIFDLVDAPPRLLRAFHVYESVKKELTAGKYLDEIRRHAEYSILYTLSLLNPDITNITLPLDENLPIKKAATILSGLSKKAYKDFGTLPHNYFKSKKSTSDILHHFDRSSK